MSDLETILQEGIAQHKAGDITKAEQAYHQVLNLDPNNYEAYRLLGLLAHQIPRRKKAIEFLEKSLELNPQYLPSLINLASVYAEYAHNFWDEYTQSESLYLRALELDENNVFIPVALTRLYMMTNDFAKAQSMVELAQKLAPDNLDVINLQAYVLSHDAKQEEASQCYQKILDLDPLDTNAVFNLATTVEVNEVEGLMAKAKALLARVPPVQDQIRLLFALAKLCEDKQEFEIGFEYLQKANKLKRNSFEYSSSQIQQLFGRYKASFSSEFLSAQQISSSRQGNMIFIVGLPRSGTSLVEQILASHSEVIGMGGGAIYHAVGLC